MAFTSLAKKPAGFMRQHTQAVRDHSAATARLTDQYIAALKRAEAAYFDGVRRITEALIEGAGHAEAAAEQAAPTIQAAE